MVIINQAENKLKKKQLHKRENVKWDIQKVTFRRGSDIIERTSKDSIKYSCECLSK